MAVKTKVKLCLWLLLAVTIVAHLYKRALFTVTESAASQFSAYASTAFYKAAETVTEGEEFVRTVKDDDGNVVYVATDPIKVNRVASAIAAKTLEDYSDFVEEGVSVSVGAFSGIKLLSGFGRELKFKLVTVENVFCDFKSKYYSLGINQTRQQLFLTVKVTYSIIMPQYKREETVSIDYLVYDALVVGKVPEIYFGG